MCSNRAMLAVTSIEGSFTGHKATAWHPVVNRREKVKHDDDGGKFLLD